MYVCVNARISNQYSNHVLNNEINPDLISAKHELILQVQEI